MGAFIAKANEAIENDRFRPHVFARPPKESGGTLLDLRGARTRRITVDGAHSGRYLLEDAHGVRLADFHNTGGQDVVLVRPAPKGHSYLRRMDDNREFTIASRRRATCDRRSRGGRTARRLARRSPRVVFTTLRPPVRSRHGRQLRAAVRATLYPENRANTRVLVVRHFPAHGGRRQLARGRCAWNRHRFVLRRAGGVRVSAIGRRRRRPLPS